MADDDLDDLIHAADLDGLVRMIDDRCATGDWDGLLRVRDRARSAVKTGRQLWPAATLAEYRLALLAPPHHVAAVLDETDGLSGQFTIGPLTEVAAQHHTWDALRTELNPSPRAAFVAHERAIRGEVVDDDIADVLDIPLELEGWEPTYAVAKYRDNDADFPAPRLPTNWEEIETSSEAERLDDDVELAVQQLVEPWLSGSNGTVEVVCVEGDVGDAIGALGPPGRGSASSTFARPWPGWPGPERAEAPTAGDAVLRPDASVRGGCSPRSAISLTTGRSTPTRSVSSQTNSIGTAGTHSNPHSAGRCSSRSRTSQKVSLGRSAPATPPDDNHDVIAASG